MLVDTSNRSQEKEWMDDFHLQGDVLEKTLKDIAKINTWLGGNHITTQAVFRLLKNKPKKSTYRIYDLGCGNGDMLRALARMAKKKKYTIEFIGIDANSFTIQKAEELSIEYPNIKYRNSDFFSANAIDDNCDIILVTLTLHHFNKEEIEKLLTLSIHKSAIGVIINDLHRNAIAYYAFKLICFVLIKNPMAKNDGLISILKGFKKKELIEWAASFSKFKHYISWKWAFRYQWIIKK